MFTRNPKFAATKQISSSLTLISHLRPRNKTKLCLTCDMQVPFTFLGLSIFKHIRLKFLYIETLQTSLNEREWKWPEKEEVSGLNNYSRPTAIYLFHIVTGPLIPESSFATLDNSEITPRYQWCMYEIRIWPIGLCRIGSSAPTSQVPPFKLPAPC